jgi:thioredoxin-like negative regulator of GroEL
MDHRVDRPNLPVERQRPKGMERLMRATIDTPAPPDSTESATAALASVLAGRSGLTMILFRDDQSASDILATILFEMAHGIAGRNPPIQVDVRDQPDLAALYNVRTTPTILFVKDGVVVDRVVGTPTRILLESLLRARIPGAPP